MNQIRNKKILHFILNGAKRFLATAHLFLEELINKVGTAKLAETFSEIHLKKSAFSRQ